MQLRKSRYVDLAKSPILRNESTERLWNGYGNIGLHRIVRERIEEVQEAADLPAASSTGNSYR